MSYRFIIYSLFPLMLAAPGFSRTLEVKMKTAGAAGMMVFEPAFIQASPGDTVRFVPTDPSHNAQTIDAMWPAGVPPIIGSVNKAVDIKVTKAGLYGIKCKPHFAMGMVALIKVGAGPSPNAAVANSVKLPPLAAKRMAPMLAKAK
ncbi:plasmid stabilization protein [Sphingomonas panacis]|uniref:Pseudoazurin n=1 Tax=Sphingomonas panacis TaxID=1560345 RepID=A0A1B3ZCN4_9SPHN|nr:pseudoazurin [Sphingomonas panacis]AOH85170.1 plasmid stabilization protein [Sphingomonas panacis]